MDGSVKGELQEAVSSGTGLFARKGKDGAVVIASPY